MPLRVVFNRIHEVSCIAILYYTLLNVMYSISRYYSASKVCYD